MFKFILNCVHCGFGRDGFKMARKAELRRQRIFDDALAAATEIAARDGLKGLTARRIAKQIGCSVGTLYNVFENLDSLILYMNAATFAALFEELKRLGISRDPETRIRDLVDTYLAFTLDNANLWSVIFEHVWPRDYPVPEWYQQGIRQLLAMLADALEPILPEADRAERMQAATALWSGLHGIQSLAAAGKLGLLTSENLTSLIDLLVWKFIAGMRKG